MNTMGCLNRIALVGFLCVIGFRVAQKYDFSFIGYAIVAALSVVVPFFTELSVRFLVDTFKSRTLPHDGVEDLEPLQRFEENTGRDSSKDQRTGRTG